MSDEYRVNVAAKERREDIGVENVVSESSPSSVDSELLSSNITVLSNITPNSSSTEEINHTDMSHEDKELLGEIRLQEINITSSGAEEDTRDRRTKIQRVPHIMLQQGNFKEYYKPRAIPIGPAHHKNNSTLLKKKHKVKLAAKFIESSGRDGENLLMEVKKSIIELRRRFDKDMIKFFDDGTLVRMLFLDACSVLQFIYSYVMDELKKFEINNRQATLVQQDLFLLDNQIPFRVLMLLVNMSKMKKKLKRCLINFILMNSIAPQEYYSPRFLDEFLSRLEDEEPVHLLDLLRSAILDGQSLQRSDIQSDNYKRSFHNVQELKGAGIKLTPSDSCSLNAISFTTRCFLRGQLKLPPLIVDDSTARKLFNLVAYEMCPDNYKNDFGVIGYVSFLDSLIDNEQDVKYLRSAHILRNRLSSDAKVALLFNTISSNLVPHEAYANVRNKIQDYYKRRAATWMAQVLHDHFRNPCTILALVTAALALLLTALQAWYAAHPKQ